MERDTDFYIAFMPFSTLSVFLSIREKIASPLKTGAPLILQKICVFCALCVPFSFSLLNRVPAELVTQGGQ